MSTLEETWSGLVAGTAEPPSNPHLRKMVLVHARNRASHPDEAERLDALGVIRRVGGADALSVATAFSRDVSLEVRRRLLQLALEAGEHGYPVLRKLTADPDPHLAVDAVRRLTEVQDRAATPKMRNLLKARHAVVRGRAAVFLGRFGGHSLVPFLRRHLDEDDDAARSAIAWAIAHIEGRTDDPPPDIGATWAGLALEDVTVPDMESPRTLSTASDSQPTAADEPTADDESTADTGPESQPTGDIEPTADAEPTAASGSQRPDPAPGPPRVGPAPTEADGGVLGILRSIAVHPDQRDTLIARLRAADDRELSQAFRGRKPGVHPDLSVGAALAAAGLGNPRWLSPIRKLATDPEPRVRAAVSTALGALCTPSAYRSLEQLARDDDPTVQAAALQALVQGARAVGYASQARRLVDELPETDDETLKAARDAAARALADA